MCACVRECGGMKMHAKERRRETRGELAGIQSTVEYVWTTAAAFGFFYFSRHEMALVLLLAGLKDWSFSILPFLLIFSCFGRICFINIVLSVYSKIM